MKTYIVCTILLLNSTITVFGQNKYQDKKLFIGYETLEMSMNKFQNFAGEIGYRFNKKNQVRLMIGEVKLTEAHLSSSWQAAAVNGKNVTGYFRIYELYYDRFFGKRKNWYYSGSAAFVQDQYKHTIYNNKIDSKTATVGFALGYKKTNLFGVKHLYVNASLPFRYYFNAIPETQWGATKIQKHQYVNNIWIFLGYNF